MKPKHVALIVLFVLTLIIVIQNLQSADLHILFLTISMPSIILLLITFLTGFLAGYLLAESIAFRKEKAKKNRQAAPK